MTNNTTATDAHDATAGAIGAAPAILAELQSADAGEGATFNADDDLTAPGVTATATTTVAIAQLSRDEMRAKIFAAKPKTELVEDFYGTSIELRQPSIAVALETRNQGEDEAIFTMLLNYAYVPGTEEKIFEREDVEMLRGLPFGPSMTDLMAKVNRLLGIDGAAIEEMLKDATKSAEG